MIRIWIVASSDYDNLKTKIQKMHAICFLNLKCDLYFKVIFRRSDNGRQIDIDINNLLRVFEDFSSYLHVFSSSLGGGRYKLRCYSTHYSSPFSFLEMFGNYENLDFCSLRLQQP